MLAPVIGCRLVAVARSSMVATSGVSLGARAIPYDGTSGTNYGNRSLVAGQPGNGPALEPTDAEFGLPDPPGSPSRAGHGSLVRPGPRDGPAACPGSSDAGPGHRPEAR